MIRVSLIASASGQRLAGVGPEAQPSPVLAFLVPIISES